MDYPKIVQVLPAGDWYKVYWTESYADYEPLAALALLEDEDGARWLNGMVCGEWGLFVCQEEPHSNYAYVKGQDEARHKMQAIERKLYPPAKQSINVMRGE
jgi:hypothetical protein